jgi:hypothetical protein
MNRANRMSSFVNRIEGNMYLVIMIAELIFEIVFFLSGE